MAAKRGLGRGLSALLGEDGAILKAAVAPQLASEPGFSPLLGDAVKGLRGMPTAFLAPSRYQPRRKFADAELDELAASIRERGILQPILVRKLAGKGESYEIIAGERRWRAAQRAGLHEVPVLIQDFSDQDALAVALLENVQRQDLTPLEEAEAYQRLVEEFHLRQEDIAQLLAKSRSYVANLLRLNKLPAEVKAHIQSGTISAAHARTLLASPDPAALARDIITRNLSVRDTEVLVYGGKAGRAGAANRSKGPAPAPAKDADTKALERRLSTYLGLKVDVAYHPKTGRGQVTFYYDSLDQFDALLRKLGAM